MKRHEREITTALYRRDSCLADDDLDDDAVAFSRLIDEAQNSLAILDMVADVRRANGQSTSAIDACREALGPAILEARRVLQ